jgi:hypothetical protein
VLVNAIFDVIVAKAQDNATAKIKRINIDLQNITQKNND